MEECFSMMKDFLSKRLMEVAKFVPQGVCVADIGADHGKLLVYLAGQKKITSGIAGELNRGPWKNASAFVHKTGHQSLIDVRLGNGLEVIDEKVDVIVIAGMGGALIASILEDGQAKLKSTRRLILQPNIGENRLRKWLEEHHWQLVEEEIVQEDGIYYEILVAEPNVKGHPTYDQLPLSKERFYQIGPLLWKKQHPLLVPKLQLSLLRKSEVRNQLKRAKQESVKEKIAEIDAEIRDKEQVIKWLSMEKHSSDT
jgi:tRNA (adenine22-N1)-methyltransferase